jgi:proteasome lid subunit RPN8/RPN11
MTLWLAPWHRQQLQLHAELTYPEECCGLLLGTVATAEHPPVVQALWPAHNIWDLSQAEQFSALTPEPIVRDGSRSRNFTIDPVEILRAQKAGRTAGWCVLGVYHSHTDHPAMPSEFDRAIAWSDYIYLIIAVQQGQMQTIRHWQLDEEGHFHECAIAYKD